MECYVCGGTVTEENSHATFYPDAEGPTVVCDNCLKLKIE